MDAFDQIFQKYANKNIIMKWSDKDFKNLLDDLYNYFQNNDDVTEFMATLAGEYIKKYNIDLVEPEEFEDLDFNIDNLDDDIFGDIPHHVTDNGLSMGDEGENPHKATDYGVAMDEPVIIDVDEIKRMKKLAGLNESEEKLPKNQVLTFNSEEDRDIALEWLKEVSNYPKEVKKYVSSRLYYKPEDAVSILFPTDNNLNKGLDENKFIGIVEILHREINKSIPNSRTIKLKK